MSTAPSEIETNQSKLSRKNSSFSKENHEKSDEDSAITNIDSEQSVDDFSILQRISSALNDIISKNEKENIENNASDCDDSLFFNEKVPKISIEDYLKRIKKYTHLEDSTLVIALIYIDRLLENQNIKLSKYNVYRILLSAILLAIKYNEDEIYDNSYFAKVFGIKNKELNKLENEFLNLIEFKLFISKKTFQSYSNEI